MIEAAWNTFVKLPLPWVRTLDPDYWAQQKVGDKHGPDKYKELQPESYVLLDAIQELTVTRSTILDVGCNHGRHMKALRRRGYKDVAGVDVVATGPKTFPATFQNVLPLMATWKYDLVFTFGMTIELVPPSFPICHEMARIARKAVVLMVQETGVPYPRLYRHEFEREGFKLTKYMPLNGNSLFVFERR